MRFLKLPKTRNNASPSLSRRSHWPHHLIIELAKDILMQGQRINKGQSGAMA